MYTRCYIYLVYIYTKMPKQTKKQNRKMKPQNQKETPSQTKR